jgi:mRNA interferase HicA
MNYREIARRLRQLGCVEIKRRSGGSHQKWKNPAANRATVLPDWGGKDLKLGTVKTAVKQLGLDWQVFDSLR